MSPLDTQVLAVLTDRRHDAASRARVAVALIESTVAATPDRPVRFVWHRYMAGTELRVSA